jgi:hypothetical protein
MNTRVVLSTGFALAVVCLYAAYRLYGLDIAVQLSFSLALGVVGSYVASVVFSKRVERTVLDFIGLDSQLRTLGKQVRELQKVRLQLEDKTAELPSENRAELRELLRGLNDVHGGVKESFDRLDQSLKVITKMRDEK